MAVSAFAQKVQVELYYESQCPGCRATITGSFAEAFTHDDLLDMADVNLYPYGNAHEYASGDSWIFSCQHGTAECEYNMIEVCGQHYILEPYQQFDFIDCVETIDQHTNYSSVLKTCTDQVGATQEQYDNIYNCWDGTNTRDGIEWQHQIAESTDALNPRHTYVPWVVAQGTHSDSVQNEVQSSLWNYVCSNYQGSNKSPDCPATAESFTAKTDLSVCAREEYFLQ